MKGNTLIWQPCVQICQPSRSDVFENIPIGFFVLQNMGLVIFSHILAKSREKLMEIHQSGSPVVESGNPVGLELYLITYS